MQPANAGGAAEWAAAEEIRKGFERLKAQSGGQFSPEWIALLLEIAPQIQFRPLKAEAVAPLRPRRKRPSRAALPPRRAARRAAAIGCSRPTETRAENASARKSSWTRRLAARSRRPARASSILPRSGPGSTPAARQAAALKGADRELVFPRAANQAADRPGATRRSRSTRSCWSTCRFHAATSGGTKRGIAWATWPCRARGCWSSRGLSPDGRLTQLMPQAAAARLVLAARRSYDGQKIVFCFKPHNEKAFHLYEIKADGRGLAQLTDGRFDDFDPVYLPDGRHVLFSTTRGHTYVRCMPPTNAFVLARCDRDGRNIYFVSANNEPDYLPSVMNDGRVIYTRWEYTDKPLWRAEKLWTINPDGTQVSMFWGNQSVWPDVMKDVRAIPGSRRVMFTGCGHHNWFAGSIGIVDPDRGFNFPDGLTKVTAELPWPEVGNAPLDPVESPAYHRSGNYTAYFSPYPLGEHDFLASAESGGKFLALPDGHRRQSRADLRRGEQRVPRDAPGAAAAAAGDRRPRGLARAQGAPAPGSRRDLQQQRLSKRPGGAARQGPLPARARRSSRRPIRTGTSGRIFRPARSCRSCSRRG